MTILLTLLLVAATQGETNAGSCKDMLQGYLTGQLSSALGAYQVEALRREFKSFTDVLEKSMKKFKETMKSEVNTYIGNSSVVYTRWGKKTCPSNAELVHSGFTGGSHYTHKGAAVEPLCLPRNPEWGLYNDGYDAYKNLVFGGEYRTGSFTGNIRTVDNHDVPCALCLVRRKSVVQMFPEDGHWNTMATLWRVFMIMLLEQPSPVLTVIPTLCMVVLTSRVVNSSIL
ncbi:uncharacterized protein [Magallana gigas]|uniref:uncharacterized protein isoform X2 n=1 Tax=Magallana gigas TaxID=29159 RepID=UPI00333F16CA